MVSHHTAKFGGHWRCGNGDVKFTVYLYVMRMARKHKADYVNRSDIGHTRLKQQ